MDTKLQSKASSWLIIPYFALYATTTTINSVVWPVLITGQQCSGTFSTASCVETNTTNSTENTSNLNNTFVIITGVRYALAVIVYFSIWNPILTHCRRAAIFFPPLCILIQSMLFAYTMQGGKDNLLSYVMLLAASMPSLHCDFQGVWILYLRLTVERNVKNINFVNYNIYHAFFFLAITVAGFLFGSFFDRTYSLLFVIQFILSLLFVLYAIAIEPFTCQTKSCKNETENSDSDESSDCSEEEFLLRSAQNNDGLFSKNIEKEAPLIFSQSSYHKELVFVILLSVFTIAFNGDISLSAHYLTHAPFTFTIKQFGYCIVMQSTVKAIGLVVFKGFLRMFGLNHGMVLSLAGFNYVTYYVILSIAKNKLEIYAAMMSNAFTGLALPALLSYFHTNFENSSANLVIETSIVSSLVITLIFTTVQQVIYMKTKWIYPPIVFAFTAAALVLGFLLAAAVYFSTKVHNKRRTKKYADKLLNDDQ